MLPIELLTGDVSDRWVGFYEQAIKDGKFSTEYWMDKERRTILLNLHAIRKGGRVIGLSGFCKDITENKKAEEEIKRSEAYKRALFESARDAILILRDGRFIDCNPAALLLYGRKREQIIGKTPYDFSPEMQAGGYESKTFALQKIRLAMEGSSAVFDWQHRKGDGKLIDCEVSLNKLELDGEILIQAIVRDITDRKRTMQALLETSELIRSVIDSMSDMLWCVDADTFRLMVFNSSFNEYFGRRAGGHLHKGMLPEDMIDNLKVALQWHSFYRRALEEGAFQTEYISSADGKRFLAFFNLLKAEGKAFGITVTAKDLTGIV
jgi:PAS domain S-box-containing protein